MRIVAITPLYPPDSRVGAWLTTHRFLAHLVTRGHQVTVFCQFNRQREYDLDGVHVETGLRGRSRAIDLARTADLLISHAGDSGLAVEAAAEAHVPHVRMVHGSDSVADGDLLVFNSESLRAATEHTARSIVAHPPIFTDEHRTTSGDHVTIVNCSPDKGIRVVWRLAERFTELRFLGVKGGYGEQITPRAANFETIPTQRDMRDVWERTRILLMPSLHETFGLVALEAACSGIPTIAHPTPGLVESVGPSGVFVDRDDIDGWAREIRRLQDPAEWSAASAAARQRADQLDTAGSLDTFTAAVEGLMACV